MKTWEEFINNITNSNEELAAYLQKALGCYAPKMLYIVISGKRTT